MRTQRLSSTLHLGTLHDVFVQMISRACRQPNYLSSSVSSRPKITSPRLYVRRHTFSHTHTRSHVHTRAQAHRHAAGPSVCHSAPAVSWKLLPCRSALKFRGLIVLRGDVSCLPWCADSSFVLLTIFFCFIFFFTVSKNTQC